MTQNDLPIGERFSQIYLERGSPQADCGRFRKRLSAYFYEHLYRDHSHLIGKLIEREQGISVPTLGTGGFYWREFFQKAQISDILDSITLVWQYLHGQNAWSHASKWLEFVQRVFNEQNLGYRVDQMGGVHYSIDQEFERNRLSTVTCLTSGRYTAVLDAFESAYKRLDAHPPDLQEAANSVFMAAETLYKIIINAKVEDNARLTSNSAEKTIKRILTQQLASDPTAVNAAKQLLNSFKAWIEAAHFYRHGQADTKPNDPPLHLAVLMISNGAAFIRWLVDLDQFTLSHP